MHPARAKSLNFMVELRRHLIDKDDTCVEILSVGYSAYLHDSERGCQPKNFDFQTICTAPKAQILKVVSQMIEANGCEKKLHALYHPCNICPMTGLNVKMGFLAFPQDGRRFFRLPFVASRCCDILVARSMSDGSLEIVVKRLTA